MYDAARHAHQIVGDAERRLGRVGTRQVRHRRGVAGEGFGAAETDRQLRDAERVEKPEAFRLAALDEQREGRSGAGAVAFEDVALRPVLEKAEIAERSEERGVGKEGVRTCKSRV